MNTIAGFGDHVCGITLASGICAALYRKKKPVWVTMYPSAYIRLLFTQYPTVSLVLLRKTVPKTSQRLQQSSADIS